MPTLDFDVDDLAPRSIRVKLGGRDYVLKEASEEAAVRYHNHVMKGARLEDGKVTSITDMASAEPALLASCLFEMRVDKDGSPKLRQDGRQEEGATGEGFVKALPSRIAKAMLRWVTDNSDLGQGGPSEAERIRGLLVGAFARPDSPAKLADVRAYAELLGEQDSERWGVLRKLFAPAREPAAEDALPPAGGPPPSTTTT